MSYVSVDVDIDDILRGMTSRDIQSLVDDLYDDGYTPTKLEKLEEKAGDDFSQACQKLIGQGWRLTKAEEEFIINISKRF